MKLRFYRSTSPSLGLGWFGQQPPWLLWTVGLLVGLLVVLPLVILLVLVLLVGILLASLLGIILWIIFLPLRLLARWFRPTVHQPDNPPGNFPTDNDGRENVRVIVRNDP